MLEFNLQVAFDTLKRELQRKRSRNGTICAVLDWVMRTFKLILGIGCLLVAINFGLFVLGGFDWPFVVCALSLTGVGLFLISKRNLPLLWKARILIVVNFVFIGGLIVLFVIPSFVRARYQTSANACINNLRQIDAAKQEWALEMNKTKGAVVTEADITPYIKLDANGNLPKCPAGGTYIIGRIGENPKCSIGTSAWPNEHVLPGDETHDWWTDFKAAYSIVFGLHHTLPKITPQAP